MRRKVVKPVGKRIIKSKKKEKKKIVNKPKPGKKPVRDKNHPLRVIAVCFAGERSGDAKSLIDQALKKMRYQKFVTVSIFSSVDAGRAKRYGFDIAIIPKTYFLASVFKLEKIRSLLKGQEKKIVRYQTDSAGIPLATGEELVGRILKQAETFLDLRF